MISQILLYLASAFVFLWGIGHLFPTRSVVKGFGNITLDNKRIITMEWIVEGVSLIFIAAIVFWATMTDPASAMAKGLYWLSFVMLNTLSVIQGPLHPVQTVPRDLHNLLNPDPPRRPYLDCSRGVTLL
jgi:hypothetical protein